MSAKASAEDVIVMPCVEQAKITELVNVLTALREMDGTVKVRIISNQYQRVHFMHANLRQIGISMTESTVPHENRERVIIVLAEADRSQT